MRPAYQWRYDNIVNIMVLTVSPNINVVIKCILIFVNIMLLTVSPNINNTLCDIIYWHVFIRNVISSYMQVSSCIIGMTQVPICLIAAPINGPNFVLHFLKQEFNLFLLIPFTTLVPNTHVFRSKRTASLYSVYPGIRFLLCLETSRVFCFSPKIVL